MKFNTIKFFEHVIGIGQQIQGEEIQKNCTVDWNSKRKKRATGSSGKLA